MRMDHRDIFHGLSGNSAQKFILRNLDLTIFGQSNKLNVEILNVALSIGGTKFYDRTHFNRMMIDNDGMTPQPVTEIQFEEVK